MINKITPNRIPDSTSAGCSPNSVLSSVTSAHHIQLVITKLNLAKAIVSKLFSTINTKTLTTIAKALKEAIKGQGDS